jgi:Sec-independent protein translocase protein TatA
MMIGWAPAHYSEPHSGQYIAKSIRRHPALNPLEILLILAVALVVLGPERMPEVIRAAARIMRELRAASNSVLRELSDALEDDPPRSGQIGTPVSEPRDKPPGQS